jgi:hypothetical protein
MGLPISVQHRFHHVPVPLYCYLFACPYPVPLPNDKRVINLSLHVTECWPSHWMVFQRAPFMQIFYFTMDLLVLVL